MKWSFSAISTFKQCPKKFDFQYRQYLHMGIPNLSSVIGTMGHKVLETFYGLDPHDRHAKALEEILGVEIAKALTSEAFAETQATDKEVDAAIARVEDQLNSIFVMEDPTCVEVISLEKKFTKTIKNVEFVGVIDRIAQVGGELTITDYKFGKIPRETNYMQLWAYQWLVEKIFPTGAAAEFMYLGHDNPMVAPPAKKDVEAELAAEIRVATESTRFDAKTSPLCGWCDYVSICEEGQLLVISSYTAGKMKSTAPALKVLGLEN